MKSLNLLSRSRVAICAAVLTFHAFQAGAIIDVGLQMQLGNPSGATADSSNHEHYLIQRTVQALDFNDTLGVPNWASWDLTADDLGSSGRSPDFGTDTSLPAGFYRVTTTDYSGSGFDRGHMCPSADRTDNDTDNELVFLMSNIIPQASTPNSGVWGTFEGYCRSLAQSGKELLIICGPSGFNGTFIQPSQRAYIPGYTWKIVVVVVPSGGGTALSRITTATRVIAIKIPNSDSSTGGWQSYITSVRQIEADTGFTFFTALPPATAEILRDKVDGQASAPPTITGFSPASGAVASSVVITGNNFGSATAVTFGGTSAPFHVDSATQITATVPTNAVAGTVSVTIPTGTAVSSNSFTVTGSSPDLLALVSHFGNFSQRDTGDTYTIVVTNLGTSASTGLVSVAEMLPSGVTATAISGVGWTANLGTLTCTRSNKLLAGAAYPPITVVVNVASNAPTLVTNIVVVSGGGDLTPANNTGKDATVINPAAVTGPVVTLFGWDMHSLPGGAANYGPTPFAATLTASHLTIGGMTRGSGIGTSGSGAARAWGGNAFAAATAGDAVTANDTITFSSVADAGYTVSYTAISKFDYRHSATGPATGILQYQIGTGPFTDITSLSYPDNTSGGASLSPINLAGVAALQNVGAGTNVTFRLVNYGGASSGTWYIFDVANSTALDFAVEGTIAAVPTNRPDLTISLAHAGNFRQGNNNDSYTITVTNKGTGATIGAVTVSNSLPAGLTATALSGSGWNVNLPSLTATRAENLAAGAGYPPLTLVVSVATNATASVTNLAIVSGGSETNTANNVANDPTLVIPLTPIEFWRLQWFGTADNVGVAADTAVASSDGMPNLLKYAFGLDPLGSATNPVIGDITTGYLRLTSPRNPAATDLSFFAETTDTLTSGWTTNGITVDQNGAGLFRAHRNPPVSSAPGAFLRLNVVRNQAP